jgi:2,5-dihydroxypyridine 5,6-dioxygenase
LVELAKIFVDLLKLSKVGEGERLLILSDPVFRARNPGYVEAYRVAAEIQGAKHMTVELPDLGEARGPLVDQVMDKINPEFIDFMKTFSFVINPRVYSKRFCEVFKAGVRGLSIKAPASELTRLFPITETINRAVKCAKILANADEIRVTSEAGTDLTCSKKGRKGSRQCSVADVAGMWDWAGNCNCGCAPLEDSMNGTLVITPGDALIQLRLNWGLGGGGACESGGPVGIFATDKITCTIKDGYITKIEGGASAKLLDSWFAKWKDDRSYGSSHIGWGCDRRADWTMRDWEPYYGCMTIAFGSNIFDTPVENNGLGGKNDGPSHLDIGIKTVDFYLDGELMVSNNKYVIEKIKTVA